jgi:hypothetical protein
VQTEICVHSEATELPGRINHKISRMMKINKPLKVVLISFFGVLWLFIVLILAILTAVADIELDLHALFRPLPSDDEMIANYYDNKDDFEKLVRIYYTDPLNRFYGSKTMSTPEVKAIMRRVKVAALTGDLDFWVPPDPYDEKARDRIIRSGELQKYRDGIHFRYVHKRVTVGIEKFDEVHKYYYYAPMIPKRKYYRDDPPDVLLTPTQYHRLYKSLDRWPADLHPPDCIFRQIDLQWFIMLCR